MTASVHPFPARMAPELALQSLQALSSGAIVLDPMSGSGTVLRQANDLGFQAIGMDMDPLAVMMARVWTRPVDDDVIGRVFGTVLKIALAADPADIALPWIDDDPETSAFVNFWFGPEQRRDLRCWAYAIATVAQDLSSAIDASALDAIRIALSRIIITKEQCASLARDTSHSRPHRVSTSSEYSVFLGMDRSMKIVRRRLSEAPAFGGSDINLGDARAIGLDAASVDAVITSPPYLNAIDYMRGHRMSLVWLGHSLAGLRSIRSSSIGAERKADVRLTGRVLEAFGDLALLPARHVAMIGRYANDIQKMVSEVARVLKPRGSAVFVVGNSCLKGVFIRNADALACAADVAGMKLVSRFERVLPAQSRYLPTGAGSPLHFRMRTETVITLAA